MPTRTPDLNLPLWPEGVPGKLGDTNEDNPHLEVFFAKEPTGATVIVCPGGGYARRAPHEAYPVADWLNDNGICAAICQYRVAPYRHPQPLNDASRAVRIVRANASEWKLDPKRVGVLGFSAGGHLASTLSTHVDAGDTNSTNPVEKQSSRPDIAILLYPVITLGEASAHIGSRNNLLGNPPDPRMVLALSNEHNVTKDTPPTFIFHTANDSGVPIENALLYTAALRKSGVPFEVHIYEDGPHGVGLARDDHYKPYLCTWPTRCADWLHKHRFARKQSQESEDFGKAATNPSK